MFLEIKDRDMLDAHCKNCRYVHIEIRHIGEYIEETYTCRRYAPRPGYKSMNVWPVVTLYDWCGEWERDPLQTEPERMIKDG